MMCKQSALVPIPEWATWALEHFDAAHPEYGVDAEGRACFRIDCCIVPALLAVWGAGFKTLGCCCGHGQGYGVISLDLGLHERADAPEVLAEHHCSLCGEMHAGAQRTLLKSELVMEERAAQ